MTTTKVTAPTRTNKLGKPPLKRKKRARLEAQESQEDVYEFNEPDHDAIPEKIRQKMAKKPKSTPSKRLTPESDESEDDRASVPLAERLARMSKNRALEPALQRDSPSAPSSQQVRGQQDCAVEIKQEEDQEGGQAGQAGAGPRKKQALKKRAKEPSKEKEKEKAASTNKRSKEVEQEADDDNDQDQDEQDDAMLKQPKQKKLRTKQKPRKDRDRMKLKEIQKQRQMQLQMEKQKQKEKEVQAQFESEDEEEEVEEVEEAEQMEEDVEEPEETEQSSAETSAESSADEGEAKSKPNEKPKRPIKIPKYGKKDPSQKPKPKRTIPWTGKVHYRHFTDPERLDIINLSDEGMRNCDIAEIYCVSEGAVRRIKRERKQIIRRFLVGDPDTRETRASGQQDMRFDRAMLKHILEHPNDKLIEYQKHARRIAPKFGKKNFMGSRTWFYSLRQRYDFDNLPQVVEMLDEFHAQDIEWAKENGEDVEEEEAAA